MSDNYLSLGDRARVTGNAVSGHGFTIGDTVEVFRFDVDGDPEWRSTTDSSQEWYINVADRALLVDAAPARPLIDFSGDSRETSREYARAAWSRVLTPESQATLADAGNGVPVDAYALNEAVLDAMRSAATRFGQSRDRRALATKVAHLGHIVQAVLLNHADNLPAYAEGDRSRKREEAIAERDAAIAALGEWRTTASNVAADRDALADKVATMRATHTAERVASRKHAAEQEAEIARLRALRTFVETHLLDAGQIDQCVGFTHGYVAAEQA